MLAIDSAALSALRLFPTSAWELAPKCLYVRAEVHSGNRSIQREWAINEVKINFYCQILD